MDTQRPNGRSARGFASMDRQRQREIASKGGRAAHEKGTAHEFTSAEAANAAKRGHERGTAHEFTPEEARIAGRKGGLARAGNRAAMATNGPAASSQEVAATADRGRTSDSAADQESPHNPT